MTDCVGCPAGLDADERVDRLDRGQLGGGRVVITLDEAPRPLTDTERAVIERLLSVSFPGRDELLAQLPHVTVEGRCGCGCVTVNLAVDRAAAPAPVLSSAPVSADLSDGEDYAGIVLLVDGDRYLSCLEVYSMGNEPVRQLPPAERINPVPRQ